MIRQSSRRKYWYNTPRRAAVAFGYNISCQMLRSTSSQVSAGIAEADGRPMLQRFFSPAATLQTITGSLLALTTLIDVIKMFFSRAIVEGIRIWRPPSSKTNAPQKPSSRYPVPKVLCCKSSLITPAVSPPTLGTYS